MIEPSIPYLTFYNQSAIARLIETKADLNRQGKNKNTPLTYAAEIGDIQIIETLIQAGADIEARGGSYSATPLYYAAKAGHAEVVQRLLEAGAKTEARDQFCYTSDQTKVIGYTPLHQAAKVGHAQVVQILLQYQANIGAQDSLKYTLTIGDSI